MMILWHIFFSDANLTVSLQLPLVVSMPRTAPCRGRNSCKLPWFSQFRAVEAKWIASAKLLVGGGLEHDWMILPFSWE